jgi:hypothetical protein
MNWNYSSIRLIAIRPAAKRFLMLLSLDQMNISSKGALTSVSQVNDKGLFIIDIRSIVKMFEIPDHRQRFCPRDSIMASIVAPGFTTNAWIHIVAFLEESSNRSSLIRKFRQDESIVSKLVSVVML